MNIVEKKSQSKMSLENKSAEKIELNLPKKNVKKALLLSIFLGFLGMDRFYIKHHIYGSIKLGLLLSGPLAFHVGHVLKFVFIDASGNPKFLIQRAIILYSTMYLLVYLVILKYFIPFLWFLDTLLIVKATKKYNKKISVDHSSSKVRGGP